MDRPIIYTQEQGRSTDFLFSQRSAMIAIAKLSQAAFGSNTVVRGLAVSPNSPAALNVLVGLGEIYTMADVDATTWGSMAADTDQILQQGINSAVQTISTPAPTTAGYSINYLIEAQFQSQDTNPVVLPFYNSANPQQPLNGQGGNGATLPTERQGVCVIQAKAGIAATTGTQVTPTVDSGWTALAVVTVANGQASVGSGNISIPTGVPQITSLLQMMQTDATNYAGLAGGTANAITATLSPAPTSYTDYLLVTVRIAATNTGSVSLNVNGLGVVPVIGQGHQTLQGGELFAGGFATFAYSTNYSEAILLECTGGALQIATATQSQHAVQLGQVVPWMRNYIAGLTLSNDGTNPNTQIDFAPGVAADSNNAYVMQLSATMVKTLQSSGAFAAGSGNNGLFSGAKAVSTWYHCFLIRNTATGAIDAGFDTSVTAANIPAGYSAYRRVGSILTDSSGNIRTFTQVGGEFLWSTPLRDINATGVATGTQLYAVTVPPGLIVEAVIQGYASCTAGSAAVQINSPGLNDVASNNCPTIQTPTANQAAGAGRIYIRTNASQQIQVNSNQSGNTYSFGAYGWRDYRGTNN